MALNGPRGARETQGQGLVLYSFRRCPYAIRARLALAAAGFQPGEQLELREVRLQAKPPELLAAAAQATQPAEPEPARATVPLLIGEGQVLSESLAIMAWALERRDPDGWNRGWSLAERQAITELIAENDGLFKCALDRFRYGDPGSGGDDQRQSARAEALAILRRWNGRLEPGGWLLGERPSLADLALLPFVRQFQHSDSQGFQAEAGLAALQPWLQRFLASQALRAVLEQPWASRCPWPSAHWLYHLALVEDWQEARTTGVYRHSSRGLSLETVGFVHASAAHQITPTLQRFYGDLPAEKLRLLALDPQRLAQAGVEVRWEPAPATGELFPHLYGGLPLEAVLWSEVPGR